MILNNYLMNLVEREYKTRQQFAEKIGVTVSNLYSIKNPTASMLIRIKKALTMMTDDEFVHLVESFID